ncbi:MAG TPA: endolytic transglycosylase MltG [Anaerolineales bacterium]|nr:endolytic transglycosylase MltG [Anaerolineales bacterium]HNN13636.1 endolytic transglycosylase MltG [Anaerolineales bacterium]HNO30304.1 endolytic transglycosylase MltG [Anaerolineales bacterium]
MNRFFRRYQYYFLLSILASLAFLCVFGFIYYIPARATLLYGSPADHLSVSDRIEYSAKLLSYGDDLTTPMNLDAGDQPFRVEPGEPVISIADRLEGFGLISNSQAFFDYAVYTGIDLTIQSGDFTLSPAQSIVDIARSLQKFSPTDATLVILPGWRMEEIAASLPTSGLSIDPDTFLAAANTPPQVLDFASPSGMEGFFYPDTYILPRDSSLDQLMDVIARNFAAHLTSDMQASFAGKGLTVLQAVTLASIVEREAVHIEEAPLIAAVYLNRLSINMKLDADPTIQYALGYQFDANTWWKSPLALDDLAVPSPYNTYQSIGLPPAPISNPSLEAMQAIASAQPSPYYFFRAACDGSGYHVYAVTLEEQVANACP